MSDINQKVNILINREEIRTLRQRYSELLDSGQIERMGEVFTGDAVVKVTVGAMEGLPAIKEALAGAYNSFDTQNRQHYPFVHAVANHQITLTGESTASGSCYLLDFVTDRAPADHPVLLLGRYLDDYVKVDGEWRISRTELDVVWSTEQS